jgi:hypothetical protein
MDIGLILMLVWVFALLGFMWVSAHFRLNNYYSLSCQRAARKSQLWRVGGNLLLGVAAYFFYEASLGMKAGDISPVILGGVSVALALVTFGGFNFTIDE